MKQSQPGNSLRAHRSPGVPGIAYYSYRPPGCAAAATPLVFVHGYNRQVEEQASALRGLCDRLGCPLVAPYFSSERHPRYQRLGRGADGLRADRFLDACLDDFSGARAAPFYLAGFSGGAQFAHRYAMAHPRRVRHLVAVAAGWYTFPSDSVAFPRGLRTAHSLRGYSLNPEQFLQVPMTVIVGAEDTGTRNLRQSPELDASQGRTRVERARNWVAHLRLAARQHHQTSRVSYLEVPAVGHDFSEFLERGRLLVLIEAALLDSGAGEAGETVATASGPLVCGIQPGEACHAGA
ncbi:alpha/beta hydrolase [Pseudohaliea sp.]|uniref:alpha/beta hydrolase n=1 Tax=Pseudohaliea sp. TaxID=2740289 RepID=UPI0032F09647